MAKITVIVPNWNRRDLLQNVLRDLARQTCPAFEVLVVDNGSVDDSIAVARQLGARVLEMGSNAGFSRAVNRGIREASGDLVAVLNNDVHLEDNWLEELTAAMEKCAAWFATGKIYRMDSPSQIEGTHDALARSACAWRCGNGCADGPLWNQSREVFFPPFTAALFRKQLFSRVGYLDEAFESYLEDVDFGLRCALGGMQGIYVPSSVAYHAASSTLGAWHKEKLRRISRNQLLLVAKHYPWRWILRYAWPIVAGQMLWIIVAARHGGLSASLRGKWQALKMFRQIRREGIQAAGIGGVLARSEAEIHRLQKKAGFDRYWRVYFALT